MSHENIPAIVFRDDLFFDYQQQIVNIINKAEENNLKVFIFSISETQETKAFELLRENKLLTKAKTVNQQDFTSRVGENYLIYAFGDKRLSPVLFRKINKNTQYVDPLTELNPDEFIRKHKLNKPHKSAESNKKNKVKPITIVNDLEQNNNPEITDPETSNCCPKKDKVFWGTALTLFVGGTATAYYFRELLKNILDLNNTVKGNIGLQIIAVESMIFFMSVVIGMAARSIAESDCCKTEPEGAYGRLGIN